MNLRTLAAVSTALALIAGIVAAELWRELHVERRLTVSLQHQLDSAREVQLRASLPARGTPAPEWVAPPLDTVSFPAVASRSVAPEHLKDPEYRTALVQAEGYAAALSQAGIPLDDVQTQALATALSDEQKSLRADILALARSVDLTIPQTQLDAQHALKRRREASSQRIFDAVNPVLSAAQLSLLREQIEQETARSTSDDAPNNGGQR